MARVELAGPERRLATVHAGVDIRGDGSTEAYLGRVRKRPLEPAPTDDLAAALRRAIQDQGADQAGPGRGPGP